MPTYLFNVEAREIAGEFLGAEPAAAYARMFLWPYAILQQPEDFELLRESEIRALLGAFLPKEKEEAINEERLGRLWITFGDRDWGLPPQPTPQGYRRSLIYKRAANRTWLMVLWRLLGVSTVEMEAFCRAWGITGTEFVRGIGSIRAYRTQLGFPISYIRQMENGRHALLHTERHED